MRTNYAQLTRYEKSQIGGLTKRLNCLYSTSENDQYAEYETLNLDHDDTIGVTYGDHFCYARVLLFKVPKKITAEQSAFGKAWLRDNFFKQNGGVRNGKATEGISGLVLNVSRSVSRFEFVGVLGLLNSFNQPNQHIPIYRAFDRKGNYFDYAPVHWGKLIVVSEGGAQ